MKPPEENNAPKCAANGAEPFGADTTAAEIAHLHRFKAENGSLFRSIHILPMLEPPPSPTCGVRSPIYASSPRGDNCGGLLLGQSFHIILVVSWTAATLCLLRRFVCHCATEKGSIQSKTFKVRKRRLPRAITKPAMIATIQLRFFRALKRVAQREAWIRSRTGAILSTAVSTSHFIRRLASGGEREPCYALFLLSG